MKKFPQKTKERKSINAMNITTNRTPLADETDDLIYAVCERFFELLTPDTKSGSRRKGAATAIAEWLESSHGRPDLNREKIYPLVWEAFHRNFLLLSPPVEKQLPTKIIEKFALQKHLEISHGEVTVVNVSGSTAPKNVSAKAADKIIDLILRVYHDKRNDAIQQGKDPDTVRVHIGFGAGYTAEEVARRLSNRTDVEIPRLTLHAVSPGGYFIAEQQKDTSTYFSFFKDTQTDVQCVGFFSTPISMTNPHDTLRDNPALRECFEKRNEIDIVVTSLAASKDPHGLVRQYFSYLKERNLIKEDVLQTLKDQDWVGDILFQPYSATKAIFPQTVRTVALFEFDELLEFSRQPNKYVVLIGGPCGKCHTPKVEALRPLLEEPSLRAWTHLVLDRETATQLVNH